VNGKSYVGSSVNIKRRWYDHRSSLNRGAHENPHLQNSWNKYGAESFYFGVLEFVDNKRTLISREQYWIDLLEVVNFDKGYNISPSAGSCLGVKHSDETRKRISLSMAGSSNPFYGKHHTEETKRGLSSARIGRNIGEDNHFYGRHHTEETKKKMLVAKQAVELEFMGEVKVLGEWAKCTGISRLTLSSRIFQLGWSTERALTTPVNQSVSVKRVKQVFSCETRKKMSESGRNRKCRCSLATKL